ncbi:hypothetical protein BHE74_00018019 [Ensete ventricosum]|nr:hypothetical protein BHE74_00018019 [Ensete ventricosum]RZS20507.1 hypothetical protein BHM03_00053044 [Ensete ventricosum]
MFLKLRNFPREKKVTSLLPEDGKKKVELKTNFWFEHDKSVTSMLILFAAFPIVGAVVVGLDQYINYYKLQ